MNPELETLLAKANARVEAMTPAEREAMYQAQRESFARAMMPAGHGMTREQIVARIAELDAKIASATGWGAALGEMHEEREELRLSLRRFI